MLSIYVVLKIIFANFVIRFNEANKACYNKFKQVKIIHTISSEIHSMTII